MLPHVLAWAFFAACGVFYPSTERAALRFNDLFFNLFNVAALPALLANDTVPSHEAASHATTSLPLYGAFASSPAVAPAFVDPSSPAMRSLPTTADISGGGEPAKRAATPSLVSEVLHPLPRSVPQYLHGSYDRLSHCASRHSASCEIAVTAAGNNAPSLEPGPLARFSDIFALLWAPLLVYGCMYLTYQHWRLSARIATLEGSLEQQPGYIVLQQKVRDLEILLQRIKRSAMEQTDSLLAAATEAQHLERQLERREGDLVAVERQRDALKRTAREASDRLDDAKLRTVVLEEQEKRSRRAHDTLLNDKLYAIRRANTLEAQNTEQKAEIEYRKQLHSQAVKWAHGEKKRLGDWEHRLCLEEYKKGRAQEQVEIDMARMATLEKEKVSLEKEIAGLFAQLQDAELKAKSLSNVENNKFGLRRELEALENDVRKQRRPTERTCKRLERELEKQKKLLVTREKSISEIQKASDCLRKERDGYKSAFEKEKNAAEGMSARLTAANKKASDLEKAANSGNARLQEQEEMLQHSHKTVSDLQEAARVGNAKLKQQEEMLQQSHESVRNLQEAARVGNAKLQEQEEILQQLRSHFVDELEGLKKLQNQRATDFEQLKANTRDEVTQAFADAVANMEKRFGTNVQVFQARVKELETEVKEARSEIEMLKSQKNAPAPGTSWDDNGPRANRTPTEAPNAHPDSEIVGAEAVATDGSSDLNAVGEGSTEPNEITPITARATSEEAPVANESKNEDMQDQDSAMPGSQEVTTETQTDQQPQTLPARVPDQPRLRPDGSAFRPCKMKARRPAQGHEPAAPAPQSMPPPGYGPVDPNLQAPSTISLSFGHAPAASSTTFSFGQAPPTSFTPFLFGQAPPTDSTNGSNPASSTPSQDHSNSAQQAVQAESGENPDDQEDLLARLILAELENECDDSEPSSGQASQPEPQTNTSSAFGDSSEQAGTNNDADSEADADFEWENALDPVLRGNVY